MMDNNSIIKDAIAAAIADGTIERDPVTGVLGFPHDPWAETETNKAIMRRSHSIAEPHHHIGEPS